MRALLTGRNVAMRLGAALVFLGACSSAGSSTAAPSTVGGTAVPSTTAANAATLDPGASRTCPPDIRGMRLSGGHLVAAFDTTVGATLATGERILGMAHDELPFSKMSPSKPVVLCWYADVVLTPPFGGSVSRSGGVTIFVDGQGITAMTVSASPQRPSCGASDACR